MRKIALTGAGGYIARQLIEDFENKHWCERILGTDIVEPGIQTDKLIFRNQDIRDDSLYDFWKDQEIDTMVHLAFIVNPIHDENKMYDVNVNGTLKYTSKEALRIMLETHDFKLVEKDSGNAVS